MSTISQKGASGALSLQAGGSYPVSTDGNLVTLLGTRWDLSDGREVMLVSNGATAIQTAGLLCQDAAITPNHQNMTVVSFTAYSATGNIPASAVVTLGATAVAANQYQGGFAVINAGPGIGQTLRIASQSAATSASNATITFEDAPNTALTTSSKVSLIPPHGANVVVFPNTPTGAAVGVTLYPLAAGAVAGSTSGTYTIGFVTSKGLTSLLSDAAVASVGQSVSPSVTTVGGGTVGGGTGAVIGYANQTAVSAEARTVFVNL